MIQSWKEVFVTELLPVEGTPSLDLAGKSLIVIESEVDDIDQDSKDTNYIYVRLLTIISLLFE